VAAAHRALRHVKPVEILPGPLTIPQYIHIREVSSSFCTQRVLLKSRWGWRSKTTLLPLCYDLQGTADFSVKNWQNKKRAAGLFPAAL